MGNKKKCLVKLKPSTLWSVSWPPNSWGGKIELFFFFYTCHITTFAQDVDLKKRKKEEK